MIQLKNTTFGDHVQVFKGFLRGYAVFVPAAQIISIRRSCDQIFLVLFFAFEQAARLFGFKKAFGQDVVFFTDAPGDVDGPFQQFVPLGRL